MNRKFTKSFYDWCIENNRQDLLNRWDYELNQCSPKDITYGTKKKYYFKCPKGIHKSELKNMNSLISIYNKESDRCIACNSFAQYLIDIYGNNALKLYWSNQNTVNPWEITIGSHCVVKIVCQNVKYHGCYNVVVKDFVMKHSRCPYCCDLQINPKDSFAQWGLDYIGTDFLIKYWDWEKNEEKEINPWKIARGSDKKIWIRCQEKSYHDSYLVRCKDFTLKNSRCPYCRNLKVNRFESLGWKYPKSLEYWSDKNKISPYEYTFGSNKKVWWKCLDGKHDDYVRSIHSSIIYNFRCPKCTRKRKESILQEKVRKYLEVLGFMVKHEYDCTLLPINPKTNHGMPFDNEIIVNGIHLLIETQGKQHLMIEPYRETSYFLEKELTPQQALHKRKLYDRYKKYIAFCNGYFYLAISYSDIYGTNRYKRIIDNKIKEISNINKLKAS